MFINKKNKNSLVISKKFNKAFTIAEVIIATFISVIILSFVFIFLSNILDWISETNEEVKVLSSFYDFTNKINNYHNVYKTWWILVDNIDGSDIFLMEDLLWQNGVLIGPINLLDSKLDTNNVVYQNKWVWFRKISSTELSEIEADNNVIYTYEFQKDQIFSDLKTKDLIIISYNSWSVYDLSLIVDLNFHTSLVWQLWENLPKNTLRKFNINF